MKFRIVERGDGRFEVQSKYIRSIFTWYLHASYDNLESAISRAEQEIMYKKQDKEMERLKKIKKVVKVINE